ncbi:MAG: hypothetical protein ACRDJJ_00760 [Actinomycetota bacterium]
MALLTRLEEDFAARRDSGELATAFARWCRERESVAEFPDIDSLLGVCRDPEGGNWGMKDAALSALCAEAAGGDQDAATALLWLLLPGLILERARIGGVRSLGGDELEAELLAGIWEEAARVTPGDRRVARRLLNGARWRALGAIRDALDWAGRAQELTSELEETHGPQRSGPGPEEVLTSAVRDGTLSGEDGELILATRQTIRRIARKLGLSLTAAEQRRHRARARLREWLSGGSHEPPAGLPL